MDKLNSFTVDTDLLNNIPKGERLFLRGLSESGVTTFMSYIMLQVLRLGKKVTVVTKDHYAVVALNIVFSELSGDERKYDPKKVINSSGVPHGSIKLVHPDDYFNCTDIWSTSDLVAFTDMPSRRALVEHGYRVPHRNHPEFLENLPVKSDQWLLLDLLGHLNPKSDKLVDINIIKLKSSNLLVEYEIDGICDQVHLHNK